VENPKPISTENYKKWLKDFHDVTIDERTVTHYQSVTNKIKVDFETSHFWLELNKNLKEYDDEYRLKFKYPLLMINRTKLDVKPFNSFLLKTQRRNIFDNANWPNPPDDGWILPTNWYSKTNDILRTYYVVKYLDDVDFLVQKLKVFCTNCGKNPNCYYQAKMDGYYAAHLYIQQEFEVPKITWDTEKINISIEFQITTQLQEVLRTLLHKYYEEKRKTIRKTEEKEWPWDYRSDEFTANYLGHILHYVEGMIMEIREKQTRDDNDH